MIKDIKEDLKEILGRDPTAKEVEEFLKDLNTETTVPSTIDVNDPKLIKTAKEDLKELMGRDPTDKELQDFLKDLQEDDPKQNIPASMGLPVLGNPLLGFELERRSHLPSRV